MHVTLDYWVIKTSNCVEGHGKPFCLDQRLLLRDLSPAFNSQVSMKSATLEQCYRVT